MILSSLCLPSPLFAPYAFLAGGWGGARDKYIYMRCCLTVVRVLLCGALPCLVKTHTHTRKGEHSYPRQPRLHKQKAMSPVAVTPSGEAISGRATNVAAASNLHRRSESTRGNANTANKRDVKGDKAQAKETRTDKEKNERKGAPQQCAVKVKLRQMFADSPQSVQRDQQQR
ncbi:hypothetical protein TRSC58_07354 [Trypanosoma rangeli SC58]|uniref:Uncharacterized protein n=1 Tax=Trypanosoma rangeli SC58 TaxID=429131 RepID=A0A061ISZ4_TRYRA|nr:hypothetical protein TRSC58_07354 [Trypanosoma rangeli SC58]